MLFLDSRSKQLSYGCFSLEHPAGLQPAASSLTCHLLFASKKWQWMRMLSSQYKLDRLVWYCFAKQLHYHQIKSGASTPICTETSWLQISHSTVKIIEAKTQHMLFCVQMQFKILLYVSKMAVWTGLEPVVRNFSRRVMELKSRFELESSQRKLLYLSYFNTARCITILRTTQIKLNKTRLAIHLLCLEPPRRRS